MKYKATLTIPEDLTEIFKPEDKNINERATYNVKKENNKTKIEINAKDITALRAALNSITKIINTHENTKKVLKEWTPKN